MSFFFKSKKASSGLPSSSRKLNSADGSTVSSYSVRGDGLVNGSPASVTTNNSMLRRLQSPTPEPNNLQMEQTQQINSIRNTNGPPQRQAPDMSLYPWSIQRLDFVSARANPFPRYGAALNAVASREGDIYMMGGLINGVTVQGDLWIVEAGSNSLSCYPVQTTAEGPGARVGHASLLVGNAFIVFGGDTKLSETDPLDDTLYLLNTSTKHWSRALPPGYRPAGRYGHTLNILGSKIYIFGGQVEGLFFNDLVAFDLNALQQANSRWETLINNTSEGVPTQGPVPPARTNHTIVTYQDKLFLFGGTDGVRWYNDVWTYDSRINVWTSQECIGFIPTPREGHAAALVGDVMYVFGGRTEEGKDLGDLAAYRIPTKRWYTFQNMGPSPSPRSGHGMTAFGERIVVLAGEPSSAPRDTGELSLAYMLDTTKIRYPTDTPAQRSIANSRRPSNNERSQTPQGERSASRNGEYGINGGPRLKQSSQESLASALESPRRNADNASVNSYLPNGASPSVARSSAPSPVPLTPQQTPQQTYQPRTNGVRPVDGPASPTRVTTSRLDRQSPSRSETGSPAPIVREMTSLPPQQNISIGQYSRPRTPQQPSGLGSTRPSEDSISGPRSPVSITNRTVSQRNQRQRGPSIDSVERSMPGPSEIVPKPSVSEATHPSMRSPQFTDGVSGSSALVSKNNELLKELEVVRRKNAWYVTELGLAQKSGSTSTSTDPTVSYKKQANIEEHDKPLVELLISLRAELAKVQASLVSQTVLAAEQMSKIKRERDSAVTEAALHRTRAAAITSPGDELWNSKHPALERADDTSGRLASTLAAHSELTSRMKSLRLELDSERKARQLAEESADAAHTRASQLDAIRQQNSTELERLRGELHHLEKSAREGTANAAEAQGLSKMLEVDKKELLGKLTAAQEAARDYHAVLNTLREAVISSTDKSSMLERKLEQEKSLRSNFEDKMARLRGEHETRVVELENVRGQLNDAEELAEMHAAEARKHREVVLAGFGQRSEKEVDDLAINDERINFLQQRLEAANAMVRRNQDAADRAADRLHRAEERIAGLEAQHEQASKDGLNFRAQLQAASREALGLRSENATLQQQLITEKSNASGMQVQYRALKIVLDEHKIDGAQSLKDGRIADQQRIQELEKQLSSKARTHEEIRATFEQREKDANKGWENKLAALDNDYQSAVEYLKGTEIMLSKMKQELQRYKSQNKELEERLELERTKSSIGLRSAPSAPPGWENERTNLRTEIETLQSRVQTSAAELDEQMQQLRVLRIDREKSKTLEQDLHKQRQELENVQRTNSSLEKRAMEAERKIQVLLNTMGGNHENYHQTPLANLPNGYAQHDRPPIVESDPMESTRGRTNGIEHENTENVAGRMLAPGSSEGRNSLALDSLSNELETMRTHWQTTNKTYRISDTSETEAPTTNESDGRSAGEHRMEGMMVNWRERLQAADNGARNNQS